MMQIIGCKNCDKSKIEFGDTSIEVKYSRTIRCCEHCNNTKTEEFCNFFCSEKCFKEFYKIKE